MKQLSLIISTCALASLVFAGAAPAFRLTDTEGNVHSLEQYAGKTVVLEWFRHSCPFSKKFYGEGHMQKWQETYTGKGVIWLSISSSAPGKPGNKPAAEHATDQKQTGSRATAVLIDEDGTVGRAYGAKVTPHIFIIGPDGTINYQGAVDNKKSTRASDIPGARNFLTRGLDELLAGKQVSTRTSQPYGCGIKY